MDYRILSSLESVMFIGMFLVAIYLLIPNAVKFWRAWKTSGKLIQLSNSIASGIAAGFLLVADFLIFIRAIGI